jgi:hypothetical protein
MTPLPQWVEDANSVADRNELEFLDKAALAIAPAMLRFYAGGIDSKSNQRVAQLTFDVAVSLLQERRLRSATLIRAMGRGER